MALLCNMSCKSKYARLSVAVLCKASALELAHKMPSPAGNINPFCEPLTAMSTPHSSKRKSIQPKDDTQSTNNNAGCDASSKASRTPAMSEATPVAVSFWQASTALKLCWVSFFKMSANCCSGTPVPHSHSTMCTSNPRRWHMSIHKWLNWPNRAAKTLSPGDSVLVSAASQHPVPDEGKIKGVPFLLRKISFKPAMMVWVR